jgi:hypothetical protein
VRVVRLPVDSQPVVLIHQKEKCGVESPLPDLDPVARNIYMETNSGITFRTSDLTEVRVPPYAFTDENGNVIDAEVEMQVREFQRPFEYFLSGISLQNDSNLLVPLTVLEINASSYGQRVYIRSDNPVTIIPAGVVRSDYRLFHLDSCTWTRKAVTHQAEKNFTKQTPPAISDPAKYALSLKCKTRMEETRSFLFGRKQSPDHFIFSVSNFVDLDPQLKNLVNVNWICDEGDILFNYHLLFGYNSENIFAENIIYCDSVRFTKRAEKYLLEFVYKNIHHSIAIRPLINGVSEELNFQLAFNAYLSETGQQITTLPDTVMAIEFNREFNLDTVGVWCIAKEIRPEFPRHISASFIDEAGRTIEVTNGWMLINGKSISDIKDFSNFAFDPLSKNIFWTILPDNKIGIVFPEEFRKHRNEWGKARFKMNIYEDAAPLIGRLS